MIIDLQEVDVVMAAKKAAPLPDPSSAKDKVTLGYSSVKINTILLNQNLFCWCIEFHIIGHSFFYEWMVFEHRAINSHSLLNLQYKAGMYQVVSMAIS